MSKLTKEKPECGECIYSEYDYDGKDCIFLGCFKGDKCTGAKTPKKQVLEFDVDGVEYTVVQEEWLSYEGVAINLCIFQKTDGKWHEILHSGHFGRFLTEEEAKEQIAWRKNLMKIAEKSK